MATATSIEPLHGVKTTGPCAMVIFGATGDLTKRKLLPAIYNLMREGLLSREFAIIGVAKDQLSHDQFRSRVTESLKQFSDGADPQIVEWLVQHSYYVSGEFGDAQAYQRLRAQLNDVDKQHGTHGNYFFYFAIAPQFFAETVEMLGQSNLSEEENGSWRRVIIEKPFGHDLESARELNKKIKDVLYESQIFRIDHYLGKETVQNILVFRFGNGIFEPIWSRNFIDHVQITVAETVGVEGRGGYYETSGTLRDMTPNHIMQLISLTTMEPPISFNADDVRDEQSKVLHAIRSMTGEEVIQNAVRGQYGPGVTPTGEHMPGYRQEPSVNPQSKTETFIALKLAIDNWRWAGVPIYLRTGKRMARRHTEIAIQFKRAPFMLFRDTDVDKLPSNQLVISVQPEEGIALKFGAKVPGPLAKVGPVNMSFNYQDYFGAAAQTGYEILLYDCMIGDATLFQRADMVEAGWSAIDPVLDVWKALPPRDFPNYAAGTWGPKEADELMVRDGRHWRNIPA
ncbi:MAG TPA: glucose-6-phosphate dehydrogenase [Terriglobales bacterium]|nr:glucose-6-phosphate dehydrogenase [Terriglobales bacterium]